MDVQQELQTATGKYQGFTGVYASLALRSKLAQFAVENGLENEADALAVVAMRYFRMADSDRFAQWFPEGP